MKLRQLEKGFILLRLIKIYANTYVWSESKQWKMAFPVVSILQTTCRLKISKAWTNLQEVRGQFAAPNTTRTAKCNAWNLPVEYPSWDCKFDTNWSDGSMFNPIFWKKIHWQKHPRRWGIAKPKLVSFRKYKSVIKMTMNILSASSR